MSRAEFGSETCGFCEISQDIRQEDLVFSSSTSVAFLDRSPVFLGHTLVVPRDHAVTLFDLPEESLGAYFADVQLIGRAVRDATTADGLFVANNNIVSQSVAHLHFHLIPRRFKDGLKGFFWPRMRYESPAQAREYAAKIRGSLEGRDS